MYLCLIYCCGNSLVVGTESKQVRRVCVIRCSACNTSGLQVLILNPSGSAILTSCKLSGVPVYMAVTGLYDVDYRIVVACRDGNVYTIKVLILAMWQCDHD